MNTYPTHLKGKQQGFSIVMAIFILVVLGLLGSYMVRLSGVQQATSSYALQGAKAYQAAKAGLGWAAAKIITPPGGTCVDVNAQATLALPDLPGFTVNLSCSPNVICTPSSISTSPSSSPPSYKEGSDTYCIYQINARSEFGAYGSADYVSRELEVSIVK